jgi:hypothetical protein
MITGDYEAERMLLSCVLINPGVLKDDFKLSVEDFYFFENRVIFETAVDLYFDGYEVGIASIYGRLQEQNLVEKLGSPQSIKDDLLELLNLSSTSAAYRHWAQRIKDAKLRITINNFIIKSSKEIHDRNVEEFVGDWLAFTEGYLSVSARDTFLSKQVKDWVRATDGTFHITDLYRYLGITKIRQKKSVSMTLARMANKEKIIEHTGERSGLYRLIADQCATIDIEGRTERLNIHLPFGLERFVYTLPKNIIAIAGSQDAGKTAILLNVAKRNLPKWNTWYFSSEMGSDEFRSRIQNFRNPDGSAIPIEGWNQLNARERVENFHDVIQPNCLNIIDYLEMSDNFYQIAGKLALIYKKLDKGVAFIAIQKDRKSELGRGGSFGMEKPRLYLTVDPDKPGSILRVRKAKNWQVEDYNPNGLSLKFKTVGGCNLIPDEEGWVKE